MGEKSINYEELFQLAIDVSLRLNQFGLKRGDILMLHKVSEWELVILLWACFLGSFIAFPVNTRYPIETLNTISEELDTGLFISSESNGKSTHSPQELFQPKQVSRSWETITFDAMAPASLIMTSGSSGAMKYVQHSYQNHLASALGSNANIELKAGDRWLLSLPLYHIGGFSLLFRTLLAGATLVLPDENQSLVTCIREQKISHLSLVATQMLRLTGSKDSVALLQRTKAILLGGSAIPNSLVQHLLELELPFHVSYGSTEMASQITTTTPSGRDQALSNSGVLLDGRDLIISHEGEILVKGDTLAMGYKQRLELIDFRDPEGWFHTGDVGYVNVHGMLTVTGRMDNQFISGGENIQPEHIESALGEITGISTAVVLPIDDREFGQRPVAYVHVDQTKISAEEINQLLRKSLPGFMIPKAYFLLPTDLLDGGIKISRKKLSQIVNDKNKHLHSLK